jgi:hypothetical protein
MRARDSPEIPADKCRFSTTLKFRSKGKLEDARPARRAAASSSGGCDRAAASLSNLCEIGVVHIRNWIREIRMIEQKKKSVRN